MNVYMSACNTYMRGAQSLLRLEIFDKVLKAIQGNFFHTIIPLIISCI